MNKNASLEVRIGTHTLLIRSDIDDLEYLRDLASFVEDSIVAVAEHHGENCPREVLVILACLNIADNLKREVSKSKAETDTMKALKETIAMRSSHLIELIESSNSKSL